MNGHKYKEKNSKQKHGMILLFMVVLLTIFGVGCSNKESAPKITLDYLYGEYAEQLLRDGAKKLLGSVELSQDEEGQIILSLHQKELTQDSNAPGGFSIVSYASDVQHPLSETTYITFFPNGQDSDPEILTSSEFLQALQEDYQKHGNDFLTYGDLRLYDVYLMGDEVLLILARTDM